MFKLNLRQGSFRRGAGSAPTIAVINISPTSVSDAEGNTGTNTRTFTANRSGLLSSTCSVAWTVQPRTGSANQVAASDFAGGVFPSGTLSFAAGETAKTFNLAIAGDTTVEENEEYEVVLSAPTNAIIGAGITYGTITNDDQPPPPPVLAPPGVQSDPYIHIHGGSVQVGNEAMYHSGTYTGNPAPAESWQWQRRLAGSNDPWANVGDTDAHYTWQVADEDYEFSTLTTLANSQGSITVRSNVLGPVLPVGQYDTIAAPVLGKTSAAGAIPLSWTADSPDALAGDIWRLQFSRDAAFTAGQLFYDSRKNVNPEEFNPAMSIANWGPQAFPPPYPSTLGTPSGTFWWRMKLERRLDSGLIQSDWSNTLTDTIVSYVAKWATSMGVDKSFYVTVVNDYTAHVHAPVGATSGVRTTAGKTGKGHIEYKVVGQFETNGRWMIGVTNNSEPLGDIKYVTPGFDCPGACIAYGKDATSCFIYLNGASNPIATTSLPTPIAIGDWFAVDFDTDAATVVFRHKDSDGTITTIANVTLTSQVPASTYHAWFGGYRGSGTDPALNDACLLNAGAQGPFQIPPLSGHDGF